MASASSPKDDDKSWQNAQHIHDEHQWKDSSDEDDLDNQQFFDAHDTDFKEHRPSSPISTSGVNVEADLLHQRLNTQLSTNESTTPKKSPG